jgi:hypothetical protein
MIHVMILWEGFPPQVYSVLLNPSIWSLLHPPLLQVGVVRSARVAFKVLPVRLRAVGCVGGAVAVPRSVERGAAASWPTVAVGGVAETAVGSSSSILVGGRSL